MPTTDFLSELSWRNLIHQCTDDASLKAHLASGVRRGYVGFDPTADSLTVGNLVPLMMLVRLQRCGHTPVVVAGGGTGLIGDPSGKSAERQLQTAERVAENVQSQMRIFQRMLDFSPALSNRAELVNNLDWLGGVSYIEMLRDVGKFFSVGAMTQKDSVRDRLTRDQGLSYTEFSYMVLQSYDYLHLRRAMGVTLQMGGSDQWGNITAGLELIRKAMAAESLADGQTDTAPKVEAFGLTTPLITKADGGKFGKSESGAVWLTADRTSPYAFYQFWLNTADADISKFLRTFTLLPKERIEELEAGHASNPGARDAHRELARHMTELLHGASEREQAEAAAKALFSGEVAGLNEATLREVFAHLPNVQCGKARLEGEGVGLIDLLVEAGLAASKRESKEFLAAGGVTLNGRKVGPEDRARMQDLLHGSYIALRRGKKTWAMTMWG